MFARFTRIPLRRCIHTHAARPQHARFARAALSASAVTASYLAWRSFSDPIALDSPTVQPHKTSSKSLPKPSLSTEDKFDIPPIPDAESLSDPASSPKSSLSDPQPSSKSLSAEVKLNEDKANEEGSNSQGEGAEGEGQASSGGAFNPETGEINWDCPCLGGMAHGPCGPEFREAFSCFVFSEQEPKGIDCIEKFKGMQDCFRRHPELYGDELMEDDEESEGAPAPESTPAAPKSEEEAILIEATSTSESLVPTPPPPSVKST